MAKEIAESAIDFKVRNSTEIHNIFSKSTTSLDHLHPGQRFCREEYGYARGFAESLKPQADLP